MKKLRELLVTDEIVQVQGGLDLPIFGVCYDSRKAQKGDCYVSIKGFRQDGIDYLPQAAAAGIQAVVTVHPPDPRFPHITWVQVKNDRRVLSSLAAQFYDNPSQQMKVVGVTGTNGKTTTVILADAVFNQKSRSAWIGTLGMDFRGERHQTGLTTPEAPDIFKFMRTVQDKGCRHVIMEASSASLSLFRVEDIHFSQGIFTSFSGDHLDFHGTLENYFEVKLSLFRRLGTDSWAVINMDDPAAEKVVRELSCKYLTFGFQPLADVRPLKSQFTISGISAQLATPRGNLEISSPLIGKFNLYNIMAAVTSALAEGVESDVIAAGIASCRTIRGRAELIHNGDFSVFIDFGHTDDALRHLLLGLREIGGKGQIILVFGAGGNKDKTKRPRMGAVAAALADRVVITSDNPRHENPDEIIDQIVAGIPAEKTNYLREPDREKAIAMALSLARTGDIVAIAGKGHEEYQIIGDRRIPFRDDDVVCRLLERKNA